MKLLRYLKQLILSDSKESSKRFIAITTGLTVMLIALVYTNTQNILGVLGVLCSYVLALVGVTTWQAIKDKK